MNALAFLLIAPFIADYLTDNESYPLFDSLIKTIYPRFIVESQRLPPSFFIGKFEQIILRTDLIALIAILGYYLFRSKNTNSYFNERLKVLAQINDKQKQVLSALFYIACLYYTYDWYFDLLKLTAVAGFYKPVGLLKLFVPTFPSKTFIHIIAVLYYLQLALSIFLKKKLLPSIAVSLLFILQLALLQSFEKIDHTFATFTYGILLLPLLHTKKSNLQKMGIAGIRLSIGLAYFFSGAEKLLTGGSSWLAGNSLKMHLLYGNSNFDCLTEYQIVLQLASIMVILFQFLFIFSIVSGKGKIIFTFAGILFHWSTFLVLNVGAFDTPWIFMYVFLIDQETLRFNKQV
jgi:hypothetical protein